MLDGGLAKRKKMSIHRTRTLNPKSKGRRTQLLSKWTKQERRITNTSNWIMVMETNEAIVILGFDIKDAVNILFMIFKETRPHRSVE